jgi:hypothetical protein
MRANEAAITGEMALPNGSQGTSKIAHRGREAESRQHTHR